MTVFSATKFNVNKRYILQVKKKSFNFSMQQKTAYLTKILDFNFGHDLLLISDINDLKKKKKDYMIIDNEFFNHLSDGDIIEVLEDGRLKLIWERKLTPNEITLFVTNECNACCLMCPQPPEKDSISFFETNKLLLKYLKDEKIKKIGITGGEPTLKREELLFLLKKAYKLFPKTQIDLLTNAKKLSNFEYAKKLAVINPNIRFCISFPSDNSNDFDQILKSRSYEYVIKAIQNLGLLKQNVELRIVILNQNYKRLLRISEFIYRNFPFTSHIVFMGMEIIGNAYSNYDLIKVSHKEFSNYLLEAIVFLYQRNMNVSIYNLPYCLIDKRLWKFLRSSISSWKRNYENECNLCIKKKTCSGLFSTTRIKDYKLEKINS